MIDLHSHILPNLDDGARDLSEAVEMAKLAAADGITDIVATPHTENGQYVNRGDDILKAVELFQTALVQQGLAMKVHAGAEVHLHLSLLDNLKTGKVMTFGNLSRYVLIELPALQIPAFTDHLLQEVTAAGITPVIAHPERNIVLRKNPERLALWIRQGVIAQLTAGSLLGRLGKLAQKCAEYFVQNHLVHVLATDSHNADTRPPVISEAYRALQKLTSIETAALFQANAAAILQGGLCMVQEPLAGARRRRFYWF
ncbi:tyrosine-protein phosphatase [Brevibacillus sp. B_LB10_24]|uniref:tyrosine-protein phosphatase n=1 Tax=Brevibacillus sp. B_LB10_24 TaxID=3380645 RepID=UPI0038BB5364